MPQSLYPECSVSNVSMQPKNDKHSNDQWDIRFGITWIIGFFLGGSILFLPLCFALCQIFSFRIIRVGRGAWEESGFNVDIFRQMSKNSCCWVWGYLCIWHRFLSNSSIHERFSLAFKYIAVMHKCSYQGKAGSKKWYSLKYFLTGQCCLWSNSKCDGNNSSYLRFDTSNKWMIDQQDF